MENKPLDTRLAFGMMRLPLTDALDKGSIDTEQTKAMVDAYMQAGFNYFDTAYRYCDGKSESAFKTCVADRYPRESYRVATKLPTPQMETPADRDRIFNDQLQKTGAGYFDNYLLHNVSESTIERFTAFDCFSWLKEKRDLGLVRHPGMSFHGTPELLEKLLSEYDFLEFVQLQLNWLDWESPNVRARECYETVIRHGRKVYVMEPVKGGSLVTLPPEQEARFRSYEPDMSIPSWAIRFAATLPGVEMVLSGMSNVAQMEDNIRTMAAFKPLTEEQMQLCVDTAEAIRNRIAIPCTGCDYCVSKCPKSIPAGGYFAIINQMARNNAAKPDWDAWDAYKKTVVAHPKPGECVGCGACEQVCPQHLEIPKLLKQVAELFE